LFAALTSVIVMPAVDTLPVVACETLMVKSDWTLPVMPAPLLRSVRTSFSLIVVPTFQGMVVML
jgi:hypothetical protein